MSWRDTIITTYHKIKYKDIEIGIVDNATIVRSVRNDKRRVVGRLWELDISYKVNRMTYKYKTYKYTGLFAGIEQGDRIQLRVNRDNPEKCVLNTGYNMFNIIQASLFTGALVFGLYKLVEVLT